MTLPQPYYQDDAVTIYLGDCKEIVPELEFGCVLTDPPYGKGEKYGGQIQDSIALLTANVTWLASLGKPCALTVPVLRLWDVPRPQWVGVWHKPASFGFWNTPLYPHWEPVLIYNFEGKALSMDVWTANPEHPNGHPTPKPLELYRQLVNIMPAGVILDPFMGSGTTLRAAKDLGRKAIGIEIEERYCEVAAKRMSQSVMPL